MQNIDSQYQAALDYIYSFINYSITRNLRYSPEKFDLGRMRDFMQLLGNPQDDYKVIHVAGTKGKGSTCAMLTSILSSAGYRTGFYSSPHIQDFNERIRVGQQLISNQELVEMVEQVKPAVAQVKKLTTFEIITGIAFLYFRRQKVEFALVEVGMGGRLDATNVVNPLISVITSISHDHMKVLGTTLGKIAGEKAGIIKPGVPIVISKQKKYARDVILDIAGQKNARALQCDQIFRYERGEHSLDGQSFRFPPIPHNELDIHETSANYFMPLIGDHQLENARTAYTVIQLLKTKGTPITNIQIQQGFRAVRWPGRMEVISRQPLIIVDGAHNRDSFQKFGAAIDTYLPGKRKILIFGASEDKEVELMLGRISTSIDEIILTKAEHPRALDGNEIAGKVRKLNLNYRVTDSVEQALEIALQESNADTAILAAGSLFIAGAVKNIWENQISRNK